jgi:hypothetical protein
MDACRVNLYDTPDLMYIQDEGAILRRILSAFSFRPTIVNTATINPTGFLGASSVNTIQNNIYARPITTIGSVTAVPMITLRLPLMNTGAQIDLMDSLHQAHYYLENNTVVPKHQTIIYSKGLIIFYVNRRYQQVNLTKLYNPQHFGKLPMTVAGFEKLNNHPVIVQNQIPIVNDVYKLRSIVIAKTANTNNNDYIVGNATLIICQANLATGTFRDTCFMYDPINSGKINNRTNAPAANPIYGIPYNVPNAPTGDTFVDLAATQGIIYIYQRDEVVEGNDLIRE